MVKLYHDEDANLEELEGKTIAVIGYGAQGEAQALCLRDSGVKVIIGVRKRGKSWRKAKEDEFAVYEISEAAERGDIIHILIPDEVQEEVYKEKIAPHVSPEKTLSWSHGFNIVFERIAPPENVDVIMVAPKAPGTEERKRFLEGFGVPGLLAVEQNPSGRAKETALAMAKGCGFTKAGVLECTFEQEVYEDLFGEHAVLCGGVTELIKAGFETLTEEGYPPEMAYFECLHELKLIVDLIYDGGLEHMWHVVSNTAEYGGRIKGKKIINEKSRKAMREILKNVENGSFAEKWKEEHEKGLPNLKKMRKEGKEHPIEKVGEKIRNLFQK